MTTGLRRGLLLCLTTILLGVVLPAAARAVGTSDLITSGHAFSCAINTGSTVQCWGTNGSGQTDVPSDLGMVASIDAGYSHACAVKAAHRTVQCWGDNGQGRTVLPGDLGPVRSVTAGWNHTCALRLESTVECWGDDAYGESTVPGGLGTVRQVEAGDVASCVVKTDGTVTCWGLDATALNGAAAAWGPVRSITLGDGLLCAVRTTAAVSCTGYNPDDRGTVPGTVTAARTVSTFRTATCALKADSTVACWGYNPGGAMTVPGDLGAVTGLASGGFHACAVLPSGAVRCWGTDLGGSTTPPAGLRVGRPVADYGTNTVCAVRVNSAGVCFAGQLIENAFPDDLGPVLKIATGGSHACAIKLDGTVQCWGVDNYGQATVPPDLGPVLDIGAGGYHTCALKIDSSVVCWGTPPPAIAVPGDLGAVQQLSSGEATNCVLEAAGTVRCWGYDGGGQATVPGDLETTTSVTAGSTHSCAHLASAAIRCWGPAEDPVTTPLGGSVIGVWSGGSHACALSTDGSTGCWGDSSGGKTAAPSGMNSVLVTAGTNGSCMTRFIGLLRCFGDFPAGAPGAPVTITGATTATTATAHAFSRSFSTNLSPVPVNGAELLSGSLPAGLTLDEAAGTLTGTPTEEGTFPITVRASDELFGNGPNFTLTLTVTDGTAPAAPVLTGMTPASPAATREPRLFGAAEAGSTVRIYTNASCSGVPYTIADAEDLAGAGVAIEVAAEATTSIATTAADAAGNISPCSAAVSYTHHAEAAPIVDEPQTTDPAAPDADPAAAPVVLPPFDLRTACTGQRLTVLSATRSGKTVRVAGVAPIAATGTVTLRAGATSVRAKIAKNHAFAAVLKSSSGTVTANLGALKARASVTDLALRGTTLRLPRALRGPAATVTLTAQTNCGAPTTPVPAAKVTGKGLALPLTTPTVGQTIYRITVKSGKRRAVIAVLVAA